MRLRGLVITAMLCVLLPTIVTSKCLHCDGIECSVCYWSVCVCNFALTALTLSVGHQSPPSISLYRFLQQTVGVDHIMLVNTECGCNKVCVCVCYCVVEPCWSCWIRKHEGCLHYRSETGWRKPHQQKPVWTLERHNAVVGNFSVSLALFCFSAYSVFFL